MSTTEAKASYQLEAASRLLGLSLALAAAVLWGLNGVAAQDLFQRHGVDPALAGHHAHGRGRLGAARGLPSRLAPWPLALDVPVGRARTCRGTVHVVRRDQPLERGDGDVHVS